MVGKTLKYCSQFELSRKLKLCLRKTVTIWIFEIWPLWPSINACLKKLSASETLKESRNVGIHAQPHLTKFLHPRSNILKVCHFWHFNLLQLKWKFTKNCFSTISVQLSLQLEVFWDFLLESLSWTIWTFLWELSGTFILTSNLFLVNN